MRLFIIALILVNIIGCKMNHIPENLIIAHRGVPYFAPEETLPSFILASELAANYLEADLQQSKDGVLIVLHDDNLKRTTNIDLVFPDRANDPVNTFTWDELQLLDAGSWFNTAYPERARASYKNLKILSLDQLIDIAESSKNEIGLYLETKLPEQFPGIELNLKQQLIARGWYQKKFANDLPKVILQSFSPQSLVLLSANFPETPLCYLWWAGEGCLSTVDEAHVNACLDFAIEHNIAFIGPSMHGELTSYADLLQPWIVNLVDAKGLKIHAYTFDTFNDISTYAPLCAGQFTNRTDLLLDYYKIKHNSVMDILAKRRF